MRASPEEDEHCPSSSATGVTVGVCDTRAAEEGLVLRSGCQGASGRKEGKESELVWRQRDTELTGKSCKT